MSFGVYLAGTFETRLGIMTQLQVVNPTVNDLEIHVFFLRPDGTPVWDGRFEVESNGMWETDTIRLREEIGRIQAGVVKIFSLRDRRLKPGIVGWQRHAAAGGTPGDSQYAALGESNLAAVPEAFAAPDYERLTG